MPYVPPGRRFGPAGSTRHGTASCAGRGARAESHAPRSKALAHPTACTRARRSFETERAVTCGRRLPSVRTMSDALPRSPNALLLLVLAAAAAFGAAAFAFFRQSAQLAEQAALLEQNRATLAQILGEVTRTRIEQSAGLKGPAALLEKLHTYAPMASNARVTEPDYQSARHEVDAILRAFESLGPDAWAPIQQRIAKLDPVKDYEELKQLLDASLRVDPKQGTELVKDVLLGHTLPSPRLRWYAADLLTKRDRPLAQLLLRQILAAETFRGIDMNRAQAYGASLPDPAAYAQTGFNNFVVAYLRTEDPETDATLLQVLGRVEHDTITIQECVEALGHRKCERAIKPIEQLYLHPPLDQQNPLFLNRCLDALVEIQGAAAQPFLERVLPNAPTDTVANQIKFLLNKIS